jgi:Pectate lyase superfamily protein
MMKFFTRLFSLCLIASFCFAAQGATPVPELPVLNWEQRSDWISIKDHGAVGDGKADDTAAIQKAFDKLKWGATIYFPAGTYRVTNTLFIRNTRKNKTPMHAIQLIGHGRDTKIVWDGKAGIPMLHTDGTGYSRIVGIDFDGRGKATSGYYQMAMTAFPTVLRFQHCAYRGFTQAGVYAVPKKDKFAFPETSFENCLFEKCAIGVSFTWFNDYDIIFDGCEFRQCGIGIECKHGNYYVRNTHFEGSTVADIDSRPEHACSVRRTTSLNSNMFVKHSNIVAPLGLENCVVSGWKNPGGAVSMAGAPGMMFDNVFTNPPAGAKQAVDIHQGFRLVHSQNKTPKGVRLFSKRRAGLPGAVEIPAGERKRRELSATQQFLKSEVKIPGKVFDAVRDFGAVGDSVTDSTAAIQKAIDAARKHGKGAIAYLQPGKYVVKKTLRVSGKDYYFGGAGLLATHLLWQGKANGVTIQVESPDNVTIEHMDMKKTSGVDILQKGSDKKTFVTYDGLFLSRKNDPPYPGGFRFEGLTENDTVLIPCFVGTIRCVDSARAEILVPTSYYGTVIVEGKDKRRTGLTGFLARFSGGTRNVIVRDNHNLVMSDFYSESSGNIFQFEGSAGDPEGRITIQGAKIHLRPSKATHSIEVNDYKGQIFMGFNQFNKADSGKMLFTGKRPADLFILSSCFYAVPLQVTKKSPLNLYFLGSLGKGKDLNAVNQVKDSTPKKKVKDISKAFDDLRRLGELDLKLNHPRVK